MNASTNLKKFQIRVIEDGWIEDMYRFVYPAMRDDVIRNMNVRINQKIVAHKSVMKVDNHNLISRYRSKSFDSYLNSVKNIKLQPQIHNPAPILHLSSLARRR